ncbi:hypothetical protein CLIB1444_03S03752 [[Candida] jaroonii]|uniref:Uncharacterized protein n=1 Tax=[Candida] jaroonii TaxID=467808 RepID=A0ACA9Y5R1_9ASCO|nr:hypothetical protein CLIB1444_03S03752 [[Candida] jaroonii]
MLFISITFLSTSRILNEEQMKKYNLNFFDNVYSRYWYSSKKFNINTLDNESKFNQKVDNILENKLKHDVENKYWLINKKIETSKYDINIPGYYYDEGENPILQPFDPRFTLAIYINHLNKQLTDYKNGVIEEISVPFHWYDWVDLSNLNKHLLAPDDIKPTCDILDAREDEDRLNKEKEQKEEKEKQELMDYAASQGKELKEDPPEEDKKEEENKEENKEEQKGEEKKEGEQKEGEQKEGEQKEGEQKEGEQKEGEQKEDNKEENKEENKEDKKEKRELTKRRDAHDPKEFCLNNDELSLSLDNGNKVNPGFNVFKPPSKLTVDIAILTGKSYLYTFAPSPDSIIFLVDDGSYNVTVNKRRSKLLDNKLVENYIQDGGKSTINLRDEMKSLRSKHQPNIQKVINDYEKTLKPGNFKVDFDQIITNYEEKINKGIELPSNEQKYYESLKYSKQQVENGGPPKYFSEARILKTALGDHYDFRFFNGMIFGTYEQTLTLHRLVRTFLNFCRKNGLNTWVAHGSLLSWYWNGIAFPWDNDIDVQMPIEDLHILSRDFNQSLIVEDVEDGLGRYFLDSGSFITLRNKGNGKNNIDARFIDVDTGLYIDITGLSVSNQKPSNRYLDKIPKEWNVDNDNKDTNWEIVNEKLQVYNCRNNHFTLFEEINPLVKTFIEGEMGYVPKKYTEILNVEYSKGLKEKKFSRHVFLQQLRLWISETDLFYFLKDKQKWNEYHNFNEYYNNFKTSDDFQFDGSNYELTDEQRKQLELESKLREKNGEEKLPDNEYKTNLNNEDTNLILNFSHDELVELLNKDEILMSYITTRDFTSFHEEEIMRLLFGKSTSILVSTVDKFSPMKVDPFMFKVFHDYWNFDDQVKNYVELINIYNESN